MPRIFDNIQLPLLPALRDTLAISERSDFCVGYFNLRGWRSIDDLVGRWPGGFGHQCRLLVGMQRLPEDDLRIALSQMRADADLDNQTAFRIKKRLAEEFRKQLAIGAPSNDDEAGLRRLVGQLRTQKLAVRLYLRHPLHAKLYLAFRRDPVNPVIGYLGSSNFTFAGLCNQGELNVDVLDGDAADKLAGWFNARWSDRWCIDISHELIEAIEESWARPVPPTPYEIYINMAYHLAQEARAGLSEFGIPRDFRGKLFDFQVAAVKIAAHHLNKRGGVLIGDVVGLGKTLMAAALARIFQDDHSTEALIICPKNLVSMWQGYVDEYRLIAKVMPITRVERELPSLRRYRLVILDESHNLRNREGKRYRAIQEYIHENESKCVLLSATPYNKTYQDLSNQLRLFIPEDKDLGIRPEALLRDLSEPEFLRRHQCAVRSLAAFEKSDYADDWRELMRLYMVRRTRTFIQENYAATDSNDRRYLKLENGSLSYFPERIPKTVRFCSNPQYALLYADNVVRDINGLRLPRYGLANYIASTPRIRATESEAKQLQDLSRAGKRLMGFCRTNLFKRLESCGRAFELSVQRHILRNYVVLHAIINGKPIPLGTQDALLLDDADDNGGLPLLGGSTPASRPTAPRTPAEYATRAAAVYRDYETRFASRFNWLRNDLFVPELKDDLQADATVLLGILTTCKPWDPSQDSKLAALQRLISEEHPHDKVLVFTQFADTVKYIVGEMKDRGIVDIAGVTGDSEDPTGLAKRFSPLSNHGSDNRGAGDALRVLIATDVLSEGQNLQDAHIVVNFDLPWAIIRLIQRAGRVDRIGQRSDRIFCYSFLPSDGVERVIQLRERVRSRLQENAEVIGTDEAFFEDERSRQRLTDLYNERAGILDDDDGDVDLASHAYQIWKNAVDRDPTLLQRIPAMPSVVYSTKAFDPPPGRAHGALVYIRTGEGNDALAWVDTNGRSLTESPCEILKMAECTPATPALPRQEWHHDAVRLGVQHVVSQEHSVGGQLGRPSGARFRTYDRLKRYMERVGETLSANPVVARAVEQIYKYPLRQSATDVLNRQLRAGVSDETLAGLVTALLEDDRLCVVQEEHEMSEPQIICSLGLAEVHSRREASPNVNE